MSIYSNSLFINESNTFNLESFNSLLEEGYNFEVMLNEACTINILAEAFDMKTIKEKIKNAWDKILGKIKEFIKKIKEAIVYIKEKVINIFCKKQKEKAEEVVKKYEEDKKESKANNESVYYLNEFKELDSEIVVFDYPKLFNEYEKTFNKFNSDVFEYFRRCEYEKYIEAYDIFVNDKSLILNSKENINKVFESKDSNYTVTLKTRDNAVEWLKSYVINYEIVTIKYHQRLLDENVKTASIENKNLENLIKSIEDRSSTDPEYANDKNLQEQLKVSKQQLICATKQLSINSTLLYSVNKIINTYMSESQKVLNLAYRF